METQEFKKKGKAKTKEIIFCLKQAQVENEIK